VIVWFFSVWWVGEYVVDIDVVVIFVELWGWVLWGLGVYDDGE